MCGNEMKWQNIIGEIYNGEISPMVNFILGLSLYINTYVVFGGILTMIPMPKIQKLF